MKGPRVAGELQEQYRRDRQPRWYRFARRDSHLSHGQSLVARICSPGPSDSHVSHGSVATKKLDGLQPPRLRYCGSYVRGNHMPPLAVWVAGADETCLVLIWISVGKDLYPLDVRPPLCDWQHLQARHG